MIICSCYASRNEIMLDKHCPLHGMVACQNSKPDDPYPPFGSYGGDTLERRMRVINLQDEPFKTDKQ